MYRNLTVLEDAGVISRVVTHDEWARFELAEDIGGHHHHLICEQCGTVRDVVWGWRDVLPEPRRREIEAGVAEFGDPDARRNRLFREAESPLTNAAIPVGGQPRANKQISPGLLPNFAIATPVGDRFAVRLPALGDRAIAVEVRSIATRGEYASWRATRATGDFDLRTFEVRAYPVDKVPELRPGMSAYTDWRARR